ncbi:MAG: hypothetical protein RIB59_04305 [Rhodospirillales bacterium]
MRHQARIAGLGTLGILLAGLAAGSTASVVGEPIAVQLKLFMVPVVYENGAQQTKSVTVYLHVHRDDHVQSVCRVVPRVRDAVNQALLQDPLRMVKDRLVANRSKHLLVDYVNRSLGERAVKDFRVVLGGRRFGKGTASKLPGAQLGCMRVTKSVQEASNPKKIR